VEEVYPTREEVSAVHRTAGRLVAKVEKSSRRSKINKSRCSTEEQSTDKSSQNVGNLQPRNRTTKRISRNRWPHTKQDYQHFRSRCKLWPVKEAAEDIREEQTASGENLPGMDTIDEEIETGFVEIEGRHNGT
jgi:hypothetical protein